MKKVVALMMALMMCLGTVLSVSAAVPEGVREVTTESSGSEVSTRSISISRDFSCATGTSWSTSFTTDKWFTDAHNAFKTIVSETSGGHYKVIIEGSNGYSYTSREYTSGCTLTTTDAQSSVTYTVYIVNTGSGTVSGNVKISSYYN